MAALNFRQQKYKKNRLLGMSRANAARAAGYSEATARVHTHRLEKSCKIADLMEREGLTDQVLIKKHKELLEAQKVVGINAFPGAVEYGRITEPEYGVQSKALELAYKLKDHLGDRVQGNQAGNTQRVVVIIQEKGADGNPSDEGRISRAVSIVRE